MNKNTSLHIRPATESDIAAMTELLRTLFAIEADFHFDAEKQSRGLRLLIADPTRAVALVAETAGRVVAMCTGQIVISTAEGAGSVWVEDVVVEKAFRGHGIAGDLLAQLDLWAKARGATRLQLLADLENTTALEFYTKSGWAKTQLICRRKRL